MKLKCSRFTNDVMFCNLFSSFFVYILEPKTIIVVQHKVHRNDLLCNNIHVYMAYIMFKQCTIFRENKNESIIFLRFFDNRNHKFSYLWIELRIFYSFFSLSSSSHIISFLYIFPCFISFIVIPVDVLLYFFIVVKKCSSNISVSLYWMNRKIYKVFDDFLFFDFCSFLFLYFPTFPWVELHI